MPLSSDPRRRERQLANLRRGGTVTPGNQHARSHGAYAAIARRDLGAKSREVYEALAADAPLRDASSGLPSHDAAAVRLLAECLCRLDAVSDYLGRHGWQTEDGEVRPAVEVERRLRAEALDWMRELGLTPKARAALGLDLQRAATSAAEAGEHREARERLDERWAALDGEGEEVGDDG